MKIYEDVTNKWLSKVKSNGKIIFDDYYIDDSGIIHPIEGKEVYHKIIKNSDEYHMAKSLIKIFGGEIHLVPRITDISNSGIRTPTPDYLWNDEKWDLKTPEKSGGNILERYVKKSKSRLQATNYVIDIRKLNEISENGAISMTNIVLENPYRQWINKIIIIRGQKIIRIYQKRALVKHDAR